MTEPATSRFHTWRLRTVALAKQVPRDDSTGELTDDGRLRRDPWATEINPFCRRAIAHAVRFAQDTGGHSTVVTMGPPHAADVVRESIAWGADAGTLVSDGALAGADCLVTAHALAAAVRRQGPADLIVVGRSSVDGDTGAIGPMVAQLLGLPFTGPAVFLGPDDLPEDGRAAPRTLRARLQLDGAIEDVSVRLPAVVSVAERSCRPAKVPRDKWVGHGRVRVLTADHLGQGPWGPDRSPTRVRRVRSASGSREGQVLRHRSLDRNVTEAVRLLAERGALPQQRGERASAPVVPSAAARPGDRTVLVAVGEANGRAARALLGEAAAVADRAGAKVVALAAAEHRAHVAGWGADELLTAHHFCAGPLAAALTEYPARRPWAILGPASPWGRELLARLAVLWDGGLVSDVVGLRTVGAGLENGRLSSPLIVGDKPCGTHHIAEIDSASSTQILTVRTGCLPVRTPRAGRETLPVRHLSVGEEDGVRRLFREEEDDYEALDRAEFVIGLGRGVHPDDYGRLNDLQAVLRAEIAATRAVTDASWLPHARQLGVTARGIAPRLYVATGVSGSPLHMAGVGRAGSVLAINVDSEAAVFAHSDIGIVGDWREVVPLLTEEISRAMPQRG
ncbi:FAD-binding protein [Streptomyces sp. NPDC002851]